MHGTGRRTSLALLLVVTACTDRAAPALEPDLARAASAPRAIVVATDGSDGNPGTADAPLATLEIAYERARPGDTIYVRSGTYFRRRNFWIPPDGGGTETARLVVRAWPGERPVLDMSQADPDQNNGCMVIAGGWVDVIGFECRNAPRQGFFGWGAHHVRLIDNWVHDIGQTGIAFYPRDGVRARQNEVRDNRVWHAVLANRDARDGSVVWGQGITANGDTMLVEGNRVERVWGEGIGCWQAVGCTVRDNHVRDAFNVQLYVDNSSQVRLERNLLVVTRDSAFLNRTATPAFFAAGIQLGNELDLPAPFRLADVTITNNIVVGGNSALFIADYGARGGLRGALIAHNTFVGGTFQTLFIGRDPDYANIRIVANIFARGPDAGSGAQTTDFDPAPFSFAGNLWDGG
nr:right-handed parallel beta-helix repeat-containing protein [Gemmatimonadaceae bacterium]MCU0627705.1 right-handed parallel beta-helix repeat-containing protein [Gemmatimonadaceae bacterium]